MTPFIIPERTLFPLKENYEFLIVVYYFIRFSEVSNFKLEEMLHSSPLKYLNRYQWILSGDNGSNGSNST